MIARKDVIVLDVRESFQREGLSLFPGIDQRAGLDDTKAIQEIVQRAIKEKKTLLVYDAAGKQVRWLMYSIEGHGLKDYWFMKGGSTAYYAALRKQFLN